MALKIERKLILASASPSRKMLLEQAGLDFEVVVSGVDETVPSDYTPAQTVEALAQRKGQAVQALRPEAPIIAADSVVSIDGLILGKPKDDEAAKATLRRLSGRTHELITGVCLLINGRMDLFHQVTRVTFYPLTEEEIFQYAMSEEPMDKAGAYGVQGFFARYIKGLKGSYANVMGLPVSRLYQELKELNGI